MYGLGWGFFSPHRHRKPARINKQRTAAVAAVVKETQMGRREEMIVL